MARQNEEQAQIQRGAHRRRQVRLTTALLLVCASGVGLRAQADTPANANAPTAAVVPALPAAATGQGISPFGGSGGPGILSTFDALSGAQTDVLFARGEGGAYPLSWKNARLGSETVVCEGRVLARDVDYTLDYANGAITFSRRLPAGTMARVTYTVDTLLAVRNTPNAAQTLHWDLWQAGDNHLRFRTLYRAERDLNTPFTPDTPQFGLNALQWTDSLRVLRAGALQTQLDSGLFVDLQGGDWLERGGFKLGERTKWSKSSFDVTFAHAGALFTQSGESGLAPGQQSLEAKLGTSALPGITVGGSIKQTAQVAAPASTSATSATASSSAAAAVLSGDTSASLALELAALRRAKIIATVNDHFDPSSGARRSQEARLELPRLKAGQTQLSGGVQTVDDTTGRRVVGLLTANSRPFRALDVTGDARLRDGVLNDDKPDPTLMNTYALKMKYAPSKRLHLTGDMTLNPEQDGAAKWGRRNAVGLESDWGLFALRGQVGIDDDYTLARSTDASDLGLDLRLSRRDTLTTAFHAANLFDRSTIGANTYTLGFKRRLGSAFDLSLNGSLTHATNTADTIKPEIKTEAKLGLHF